MLRHLKVRAENKPGVLLRVTGILTSKGLNIEHLSAGPEPGNERVSEIRIQVPMEERYEKRVVAEIHRLVNVLTVEDLSAVEMPRAEGAA